MIFRRMQWGIINEWNESILYSERTYAIAKTGSPIASPPIGRDAEDVLQVCQSEARTSIIVRVARRQPLTAVSNTTPVSLGRPNAFFQSDIRVPLLSIKQYRCCVGPKRLEGFEQFNKMIRHDLTKFPSNWGNFYFILNSYMASL